ncbi:MAG: SDR family oxidoreductase [Actinomycetota bacterium]|nr:SDR family oxidoreductase [Actinomycetota bacterium]
MELRGKVTVVTGGGSGIGEAMARRFATEGAQRVVVADLDGARAESVAKAIGPVATAAALDVSDEAAVKALVDETLAAEDHIDLFCSNAGFAAGGGVETPDDVFDRMWKVHVMAHVYAARAVLPSMIARREGYLLNTSSAAGLLNQIGSAPYGVTKAAAVSLAEFLAFTHRDQGIKVSVLCPQAVRTNILAGRAPREGGSAASTDGVLEADDVASVVVEALADERFLVLPHPEVAEYTRRKGDDRDRWLAGMARFQARLYDGVPSPADALGP